MQTPFFPQFRPRLAPCRRASTQKVQQASLAQLEQYLEGIFPLHLLSQEDDGDNSRERVGVSPRMLTMLELTGGCGCR